MILAILNYRKTIMYNCNWRDEMKLLTEKEFWMINNEKDMLNESENKH